MSYQPTSAMRLVGVLIRLVKWLDEEVRRAVDEPFPVDESKSWKCFFVLVVFFGLLIFFFAGM